MRLDVDVPEGRRLHRSVIGPPRQVRDIGNHGAAGEGLQQPRQPELGVAANDVVNFRHHRAARTERDAEQAAVRLLLAVGLSLRGAAGRR